MRNLKIILSFRGTAYHGYQKQENAVSVQQITEDAVSKVLNHKAWTHGCSRTDAGVHANGYCFSVETSSKIPCDNFIRAVNGILPQDIVILSCADMPSDFHARYSATSKEYVYKLFTRRERNPFLTDLAYHYRYPFNDSLIQETCGSFIGTHDFSAFTNTTKEEKIVSENHEYQSQTNIRTIFEFKLINEGDLKILSVKGDGFLYNMVRVLVGTVLAVNEGKILLENVSDIIKSKKRQQAGMTMPACGLYLNRVYYE